MDKTDAILGLKIAMFTAIRHWQIEMWGEYLSKKNSWNGNGRDAISLYLVKKYGWTLNHCKSLSHSDLEILLVDEMHEWEGRKDLVKISSPFSKLADQLTDKVSSMPE